MRDIRVIPWHVWHQPWWTHHVCLCDISWCSIAIFWEGALFIEFNTSLKLAGRRHSVKQEAHVDGVVDDPAVLECWVNRSQNGLGDVCWIGFIGRGVVLGIKGCGGGRALSAVRLSPFSSFKND